MAPTPLLPRLMAHGFNAKIYADDSQLYIIMRQSKRAVKPAVYSNDLNGNLTVKILRSGGVCSRNSLSTR